MIVLNISTQGTSLNVGVVNNITSNSVNPFDVSFNFDDTWDGYAKTVVFYKDNNSQAYEIYLLDSESCKVPNELLTEPGKVMVGIRGEMEDGTILASEPASFTVKLGTKKGEDYEIILTPDIVTQLKGKDLELYNSIMSVKREMVDRFDSAINAATSMTNSLAKYVNSMNGDLQNKINIEKNRINTLTALPVGSTRGDAELIDIRNGADGVVYSSAGNAIRGQITNLSRGIDELSDGERMFVEITEKRKQGYYQTENGVFHSNSNFETIEVPCISGELFRISAYNLPNTVPLITFKNNANNILDSISLSTTGYIYDKDIIIPANCTKMIIQSQVEATKEHISVKKNVYINGSKNSISLKIKQGYYNGTTFYPNSNYISSVVKCNQNEFFNVTGKIIGASKIPLVCIYDSNDNLIGSSAFQETDMVINGLKFLTPVGAAKLIIVSGINQNNISLSKLNVKHKLEGKQYIVFGDSITEIASRWRNQFISNTGISEMKCYAVTGAHLRDYADTVLNGNPREGGDSQNTVCNQVQQFLNEKDTIDFCPDFVMISAGTNDNFTYEEVTISTYTNFINNQNEYIPIDDVNRTQLDGAMRWQAEKIWSVYPNTTIIFISPIQAAQSVRASWNILAKEDRICDVARMLSCPVIKAGSESGIYGVYETDGENGKYLIDGLHPNIQGGIVLGNFIAKKVKCIIN